MKTLCEIKLIENKPPNDKSSYFLIDNFYIADSQPHIPTTMATPIIEKSASSEILSPTVEDEIDSFVTSDVENNDNDSSETVDLIDSAYKKIKYKKMITRYKKWRKWICRKWNKTKIRPTQQRRISNSRW